MKSNFKQPKFIFFFRLLLCFKSPTRKSTTGFREGNPWWVAGADDDRDDASRVRALDIAGLNEAFITYLNFGGYPEAVFSEAVRRNPRRYIKSDIIDKVLLRDLPSLYGIADVQELNSLFNTVAYNSAEEISLEGA